MADDREEASRRIRLAGKILIRRGFGNGPPVLLSEIAQLQFLAESDEERALPAEKLAVIVIDRERTRMGHPPPSEGLRRISNN